MRRNRRAVGESSSGWVCGWMGVGGGERREGIGEDGVGEGEERETEGGREVQVDKSTSGQVDERTSGHAAVIIINRCGVCSGRHEHIHTSEHNGQRLQSGEWRVCACGCVGVRG